MTLGRVLKKKIHLSKIFVMKNQQQHVSAFNNSIIRVWKMYRKAKYY